MIARIHAPESPLAVGLRPPSVVHELSEGMRVVMGDRILRALVLSATTRSFFGNFYAALYSLYAFRVLGLGPALLGLAVAAGGAGSLIGAMVAPAVLRRHGIGLVLILTPLLGGTVGLLTPFAGGPVLVATAMLVVAQFCGDALATTHHIVAMSVRQAMTPDRLLGRVHASTQFLTLGVGPLGALAGGALAMWGGSRLTLLVATLGGASSLLWLVRSPLRELRTLPTFPGTDQEQRRA